MKNLAAREELQKTLEALIKCYEKEEELLLELQNKSDTTTTPEEKVDYSKKLKEIVAERLGSPAGLNALETLALIQEVRARKREAKGISYDPIIYTGEELKRVFLLLANLAYDPKATLRLDIIARSGTHFTPLSFRLKDGKLVMGYIDGSADSTNITFTRDYLLKLLPTSKLKVYGYEANPFSTDGKLQNDQWSCGILSSLHLKQMSALDDKKLAMSFKFVPPAVQRGEYKLTSFLQVIAPFYVKYAQSMTALNKYMAIYPDVPSHLDQSKGSLPAYIENHSKLSVSWDDMKGLVIKPQNRALSDKSLQLYKESLALLQSLSDEELEEVFARRINRKLPVQLQDTKSTEELKDLANRTYLGSAARLIESYTHIGSFTKKIISLELPERTVFSTLFAASAYTSLYCCGSLIVLHTTLNSIKNEEMFAALLFGICLVTLQTHLPPLLLVAASAHYTMQCFGGYDAMKSITETITLANIDKLGVNVEKLTSTVTRKCESYYRDVAHICGIPQTKAIEIDPTQELYR